ncbi:MAG: hypothetical protein FWE43_04760 [Streptococcaceae bacterium]|nr:hypothetical protein [Streptococcaceae bacterium]MCL2681781.1 hypothetical protein [Streptococcaceae bacterium]
MIKQDYKKIKEESFECNNQSTKFHQVSSWAIWNDEDKKDTSIIEKNISKLKPQYVFVGSNLSGNEKIFKFPNDWKEWNNFHCKTPTDNRLMKMLKNEKYEGAYLTDLIKLNSAQYGEEIEKRIKGGEIDIKNQIKIFSDELKLLNQDNLEIFLMGKTANEIFHEYFCSEITLEIKSCKTIWSPAYYQANDKKFYKHQGEILGVDYQLD